MNTSESVFFVNIDRVICESPLGAQEKAHLTEVRTALLAGAELAEKNYEKMSTKKQSCARQADEQLIGKQWIVEQKAARSAVISAVLSVADSLRQQNGYGLIVSSSVVITATPDRDVSGVLVEALKDVQVTFSSVPQVNKKENNIQD